MKEQLEKALDIIRKHGWWDGRGFVGSKRCLVMALTGSTFNYKSGNCFLFTSHDLCNFVEQFLPDQYKECEDPLVQFNDANTQEDVESLLEKAIASA